MQFLKALWIAAIVSITAVAAKDAAALDEMLGKWRLIPSHGVGPSELELFPDGGRLGGYYLPGTVDPVTGEVHLSGYVDIDPGYCALTLGLDGVVAQDGRSLQAVAGWGRRGEPGRACFPESVSVQGTRCGNGIVDPWEECDVRSSSGACCNSGCMFEPQGATCHRGDLNPCTDDVCDGAGTCQAFDNSAACTPDGNCGTGVCANGACGVAQPFDTGTSCDLDESVCTPDACDGAGQCAAAPPIDCAPCADACDPQMGCLLLLSSDTVGRCEWNVAASLDVRTGEATDKLLKMEMRGDVALEDLGDPTTTTSYTVCLLGAYAGRAEFIEVGRMEIPGHGRCENEDCWKPLNEGFSYRNPNASGDGIVSARLSSLGGGIRIKGSGANLPLPASLPERYLLNELNRYLTMFVATDGASRTCWAQLVESTVDSASRFKGRGRPTRP